MKIKELYIENFGKLSKYKLDGDISDIDIIYNGEILKK